MGQTVAACTKAFCVLSIAISHVMNFLPSVKVPLEKSVSVIMTLIVICDITVKFYNSIRSDLKEIEVLDRIIFSSYGNCTSLAGQVSYVGSSIMVEN